MNRPLAALTAALVAMLIEWMSGPAWGGYTLQTSSVTSSSTPVNVCPTNVQGTYRICNWGTSPVGVLCWPYTGSLPGSAPSNVVEVPPGECRGDSGVDSTLNQAWACVLESGSRAATTDCTER